MAPKPEVVFVSVKLPAGCWISLQKKPAGAATPLSDVACGFKPEPPVPPLLKLQELLGVAVPVGVAVFVAVAVLVGVVVLVGVAPDGTVTPFKMMAIP